MSRNNPTNAVTNQSEGQRPNDDATSTAPDNNERDRSLSEDGRRNEDRVNEDESHNTTIPGQETALHNLIQNEESDEDASQKLARGTVLWRDQLNTPSSNNQQTALHMAIQKGFLRVASLLIEAGADVNIQDGEETRPLHMACEAGEEGLVVLLLDHGAEVGHASMDGWYPLHFAAWKGLSGVIPRLLGPEGPNIDDKETGADWTPLNIATFFGHEEVVEALLGKNARLYIQDVDGWTPFMTAVKEGNYDILNKLLDQSTAKDAMDIADCEGRTPLMNLCANLPEDPESLRKAKESVDKLLRLNAAVDVTDNDGRTVLHHAMRYVVDTGAPELALQVLAPMDDEKLLSVGNDGETAFDTAFNDDVAEALQPIWDSLVRRLSLKTVLHWSVQSSKRHEIAKRILSKFPTREELSRFKDPESDEWTVIEWAIYYRLPKVLWTAVSASLTDEMIDIGKVISNGKKILVSLRKMVSESTFTLRPAIKKDSQGAKSKKKKGSYAMTVLREMSDVLDFLYFKESRRRVETFELSKPEKPMQEISDKFEVAIVQMRQDKTELRRYVKFRTVQEFLYGSDAIETVGEIEQQLQEFDSTIHGSTKSQVDPEDETEFTWVHFPSTNMDWMVDAIRKIANWESPTDFQEVASFLRHSWIQIPDGTSASRFMRPRYVVKKTGIATDDKSTRQEATEDATLRENEDPKDRECKETQKDGIDRSDQGSNRRDKESGESGIFFGTTTCGTSAKQKPVDVTAIYMPYLYFSTYHKSEFEQRDEEHGSNENSSRTDLPTASKDEKGVLGEVSLRKDLFKAYKKGVIHQPSTLDEFYYHFATDKDSLLDRQDRNQNQVVTKYLAHEPAEGSDTWRLLRVSQLWVWVIADKWLITSTSCATNNIQDSLVTEVLKHLLGQTDNGSRWCGPSSATEMSRLIVDYCIGAYDRKRTATNSDSDKRKGTAKDSRAPSGQQRSNNEVSEEGKRSSPDADMRKERSIRQIFSDSINQIGREEAVLFRLFCDYQPRQTKGASKGDQAKPLMIERLQETMKKTTKLLFKTKDAPEDQSRHTQGRFKGNQAEPLTVEILQRKMKDTANHLFNIKDVRDELNILRTIAEFQLKVQSRMAGNETDTAAEEDLLAKYVCNDIKELDKAAEQTQAALHTTIALQESEIANLQAKEAVNQGKTVMVFTLVTVWFLPLSFLTSLFALDVPSFLDAPVWSLIVIFTVPLIFFVSAVGYVYSSRITKFVTRHGTQEKQEGDAQNGEEDAQKGEVESSNHSEASQNRLHWLGGWRGLQVKRRHRGSENGIYIGAGHV